MTQEEKELLLRDLCARLPYSVKISVKSWDEREWEYIDRVDVLYSVNGDEYIKSTNEDYDFSIEEIKPYLFPLSSMTEEQWNNAPRVNLTYFTFESLKCGCFTLASYTCENNLHDLLEFINWLLKNHFDVNGLIPLGLAKDATGLNIY